MKEIELESKDKKSLEDHIVDFSNITEDLQYMIEHYPLQLKYKFKLYLLDNNYYKPKEKDQ
jgi:hypothetical protein